MIFKNKVKISSKSLSINRHKDIVPLYEFLYNSKCQKNVFKKLRKKRETHLIFPNTWTYLDKPIPLKNTLQHPISNILSIFSKEKIPIHCVYIGREKKVMIQTKKISPALISLLTISIMHSSYFWIKTYVTQQTTWLHKQTSRVQNHYQRSLAQHIDRTVLHNQHFDLGLQTFMDLKMPYKKITLKKTEMDIE